MSQAVTESLFQLIAKQVDDKGLVVWYDPEQSYVAAAAELALPKTTVARYDGSFLKLRKEIDHLLNDGQPPRLVVYVPIEREKTHDALIELDFAGAIMQPRQQPPSCNTRLSVVARNALKPILGEDQVGEIERQVEAGKLSLDDLNSLADKGKDISTGVLTLIFGSANPQEVALAFLHDDQHNEEIEKKEAEKELRHLLQVSFDIELPAAEALSNWRVKLGRHVLLTDLFAALKKQAPSSLSSVSVAHSAGGVDACVRLARTWRNSREHRDSYVTLRNVFLRKPEMLLQRSEMRGSQNERTLDYPTIIANIATPERIIDSMVDKELTSLFYGSIQSVLERVRHRLGFYGLSARYDNSLVTLALIRNCIVHNRSLSNKLLDEHSHHAYSEASQIPLNRAFVLRAITVYRRVAEEVDAIAVSKFEVSSIVI